MAMPDHENHLNGSLWGLVLAAGDGSRLGGYVRELKGTALPKQYVNVIGRRSMLEHTFDRAERLIPTSRILTIVSEGHLAHTEARRQIASRPAGTVILQPENKETGPGILLPLMHLYKRCPEAIVAVFPSDHFILEEDRFMGHVKLAAQAVARTPERIMLLGTDAQWPETEYGYVVPYDEGGQLSFWGTRRVAHFAEKPDLDRARRLATAGGLWNTMVMVFKAKNLLNLTKALYPELYQRFYSILDVLGDAREKARVKELYRNLEPLNFSKDIMQKVLAEFPWTVYVLPMLNVFWSDWGSPQRISHALQALGMNALLPARPPQETVNVRQAKKHQWTSGVVEPREQAGGTFQYARGAEF
ncbi:MAG TPA: sugar phosphate nucleotidyltransferase [Candidatus Binatia bacterium]|nr:sugar phosphate nucleotidyltransferase [Candidatus Binatia bacterium]